MGIPVLVTTRYRGVFFGYADDSADFTSEMIELRRLRQCVYWSADVQGFLGLATNGPTESCRVGPATPGFAVVREVTLIAQTTPEAAEAWEGGPWAL